MSLLRAAAAVALVIFLGVPALAADEIAVVVSGQRLNLDVPPIITEGRTLVPLRAILEAVGATVAYDSASRTVTATRGGLTLILTLGERRAVISGREATLDVPAQVVNGRTLVPVRFVAEALDARVDWDVAARTVRVTPGPQTAPLRVEPGVAGRLVAEVAREPDPRVPVAFPTWWSRAMQQGCKDKAQVEFGSPPMRLADIINVAPYGLMVGAHVIPSDHQGYHFGDPGPAPHYDVLAVADGEIVGITVRKVSVETGKPSSPQYHITLRHSCSIITQYDLVDEVAPAIAAGMATVHDTPIPVREGQVIGKTGFSSRGLDLWVADLRALAPGYVVPAHYEREAWRLYAIDPYSLFREPLRSELRAKSIRRVEPRGGRADYDIDGRLLGGWFVENTNGYAGLTQGSFFTTHLAVAYHAYDPSLIVVSLGDFQGRPRQFAVAGNGPDPAQVSVAFGPVKYELRYWSYLDGATGRNWDYRAILDDFRAVPYGDIHGTALLQLIADRKLKVELFPGKRAEAVSGFTDSALLYER